MSDSHATFEALMAALIEGRSTREQLTALQDLLRSEPELRKEYVRQMRVDALLDFSAGLHAASGARQPTNVPSTSDSQPTGADATSSSGAIPMANMGQADTAQTDIAQRIENEPPLTTADAEWFIQEVPLRDNLPGPPPQDLPAPDGVLRPSEWIAPLYLTWGLAAASLVTLLSLASLGLLWPSEPASARLIGVAQPRWKGDERLELGDTLSAGKTMRLEYGALEFEFPGAATVVIRGPAEFQVLGRGRFGLTRGEITAHVPPRAAGFVVESPGLVINDLGTEFALNVEGQGKARVTVLEGKVEAETPAFAGRAKQRLTLVAGDSMGREAAGGRLVRMAAPALATMPRDIGGVRVPLRIPGSGVGLREGESDPNCRITSAASDPAFVPRLAVVTGDADPYLKNEPTESQWLSLAHDDYQAMVGAYVFEFAFDLEGIDPSTVALTQVTELLVVFRFFGVHFERKSKNDGGATGWRRCSEDLVA